jgi:hypothetical protein
MHLSKREVRDYILNFLSGTGDPRDWDDFISISLDDDELEHIRLRCAALPELFPPSKHSGRYSNDQGFAELVKLARMLEEGTHG